MMIDTNEIKTNSLVTPDFIKLCEKVDRDYKNASEDVKEFMKYQTSLLFLPLKTGIMPQNK